MNLFLCRFCIDLWIVIRKFNTAVMGISVLIIGNFSLLFSHHNKISTPKVSLGFLWCLLVKRITIRPTQISFLAAQPGNGSNVSSSLVPFIPAKIIFNLLFLTETLDWLSCCLWSYIISCWSSLVLIVVKRVVRKFTSNWPPSANGSCTFSEWISPILFFFRSSI